MNISVDMLRLIVDCDTVGRTNIVASLFCGRDYSIFLSIRATTLFEAKTICYPIRYNRSGTLAGPMKRSNRKSLTLIKGSYNRILQSCMEKN